MFIFMAVIMYVYCILMFIFMAVIMYVYHRLCKFYVLAVEVRMGVEPGR
jgi:hypothetical protein